MKRLKPLRSPNDPLEPTVETVGWGCPTRVSNPGIFNPLIQNDFMRADSVVHNYL